MSKNRSGAAFVKQYTTHQIPNKNKRIKHKQTKIVETQSHNIWEYIDSMFSTICCIAIIIYYMIKYSS